MYKNIMLKISGESLAGSNEQGFDFDILNDLSENIKILTSQDVRVSIVLGGGNFIRGASFSNGVVDRVTSDYMGMLGTVINSLALQSNLEKIGVPSRVMTALSINRVAEPYIKNKATRHLEKNRVVIFASGTGNPFFTTDSAACLRGIEIEADVVLKATKVDGIYSDDPVKNPDATLYSQLSYDEVLEKELKVMDLAAFTLARDHSMTIRVFNMNKPGALKEVVMGGDEGTTIDHRENLV